MDDALVKVKTVDRVCILTLNQPEKMNAMTNAMAVCFRDALKKIKQNAGLRAQFFSGVGSDFSAGGDLPKMLTRVGANPNASQKNILFFYHAFLSIMELEIPTIAAINGHA